MRISLDWIREFAAITAEPDEVARRLTMAGLEIEGMEQVDGDVLMEVNVTPNRPDCLSILGIAREVAALFGVPLKLPVTEITTKPEASDIRVVIDAPDLCARYTGRSILGVSVGESPAWMKRRLEKCGIRAINNIVDVTNYVLLELGHPLHAFDADKISGGTIRVARAGRGRSLRTLDGEERSFEEDTLLIWDAAAPVAVAGIMGGEDSSVSAETKNIFLESAYFAPASIRKSSRLLGLKSESSYRFERGTDREFLREALNRAAQLMAEIGGGTVRDVVDVYPVRYSPREISVAYRKMQALIGIGIPPHEVGGMLNRIGIRTEERGDGFIAVPPPFRGDLLEPVDIMEEVARCYGYGNIPARVPVAGLSDGRLNRKERLLRTIRESIRTSGFNEVVNFSFMNSADLDILSISEEGRDQRRRHIMLKNPLRQEECLMRTTLMPSLIRNFLYNHSRGAGDIRLFELSRVFIDWGEQLPNEGLRLAGIFFQDAAPALWKETSPPFYIVKGALESLFAEVRLKGYACVPSGEGFLHPGRSADIYASDEKLGFVGELNPRVTDLLDIKVQKPQVVVFEIDLDRLMTRLDEKVVYRQIPKYPAVERDIALIIDERISTAEVLGLFRQFPSGIIENVELFDYYKGKNIPQDRKSIGIRIRYRSTERTLTETEVESVNTALVEFVSGRTGAVIRGAA